MNRCRQKGGWAAGHTYTKREEKTSRGKRRRGERRHEETQRRGNPQSLLTRPRRWLDQYRETNHTVILDHLSCEFVGIVFGKTTVCLVIEDRVQVAERVAEMMAHRVQVQVRAEASCSPQVKENLPALLYRPSIGHFKVIMLLEWIVLERPIGDPAGVRKRVEARLCKSQQRQNTTKKDVWHRPESLSTQASTACRVAATAGRERTHMRFGSVLRTYGSTHACAARHGLHKGVRAVQNAQIRQRSSSSSVPVRVLELRVPGGGAVPGWVETRCGRRYRHAQCSAAGLSVGTTRNNLPGPGGNASKEGDRTVDNDGALELAGCRCGFDLFDQPVRHNGGAYFGAVDVC